MNKWLRRFLVDIVVGGFVSAVAGFAWILGTSSGLSPEILQLRREAWMGALYVAALFAVAGVAATGIAYWMVGDQEWI